MREYTGISSATGEPALTVESYKMGGVTVANGLAKSDVPVTILGDVLAQLGINDSATIAEQLLTCFGSLSAALNADGNALALAGLIDDRLTHSLRAINVMFEARCLETLSSGPQVLTSERLKTTALNLFRGKPIEEAFVLFFNTKCGLLPQHIRYLGAIDEVKIYQNEILRTAINLRAVNIAIIHSHPSGDPEPSKEDINETLQLQAKLAILNISLLDHLIVGANAVLSMRQKNLL